MACAQYELDIISPTFDRNSYISCLGFLLFHVYYLLKQKTNSLNLCIYLLSILVFIRFKNRVKVSCKMFRTIYHLQESFIYYMESLYDYLGKVGWDTYHICTNNDPEFYLETARGCQIKLLLPVEETSMWNYQMKVGKLTKRNKSSFFFAVQKYFSCTSVHVFLCNEHFSSSALPTSVDPVPSF